MEKKKKIFIFLITILLLFCNFFAIVYAYDNKLQINFFSSNKTEVTIGEIVELKIDLDKISFDNFNFVLSTDLANIDVKDIYTDNSDLDTNINDYNELSITIDKTKTNVNQINLYYKIPENVKIGDKISLKAEISMINDEDNIENETNNKVVQDANLISNEVANNNKNEIEETQVNQIVLTIVEECNDAENEDFENKDENMNNNAEDIDNNQNSNKENNDQELEKLNLSDNEMQQDSYKTSTVSNTITSQNSKISESTITYNGSQNNYLVSITVEGYELNNSFTKENTTYFISVDEETTSIEVLAETEEDTATVCIYGNDNLKEGTNKVLISVTSECGEVRNYRIYVEK